MIENTTKPSTSFSPGTPSTWRRRSARPPPRRSCRATGSSPRTRSIEKSGPHDLVTDADRKAEEHLTGVPRRAAARLRRGRRGGGARRPGGRTRRCRATRRSGSSTPSTAPASSSAATPGFCTLVALARHGEVLASWTYAPALDEMATAVRGARRHARTASRCAPARPAPGAMLHVATSHPDFTTDEQKRALLGLRTRRRRARAPAARPAWSTWPSPAASRTPWRSTGRRLGPRGRTAAGRGGGRRPACTRRRRAVPIIRAATPCRFTAARDDGHRRTGSVDAAVGRVPDPPPGPTVPAQEPRRAPAYPDRPVAVG